MQPAGRVFAEGVHFVNALHAQTALDGQAVLRAKVEVAVPRRAALLRFAAATH